MPLPIFERPKKDEEFPLKEVERERSACFYPSLAEPQASVIEVVNHTTVNCFVQVQRQFAGRKLVVTITEK